MCQSNYTCYCLDAQVQVKDDTKFLFTCRICMYILSFALFSLSLSFDKRTLKPKKKSESEREREYSLLFLNGHCTNTIVFFSLFWFIC